MAAQGVPLGGLRRPLGVVDVENHVALGHVKVPGDDGAGLRDLDQHLQEDAARWEKPPQGLDYRGGCNALFFQLGAPLTRVS